MNEWALYGFTLGAAAAALGLLFIRDVFHAALALLACLLCMAAIFILVAAEFLAVTQILIYAGGIIVVVIFGIMLTTRLAGKPESAPYRNRWLALASGGGLFFLLARIVVQTNYIQPAPAENSGYIRQLGVLLFTQYSYAFELAGLLLLVSLVAASFRAISKIRPHA